MDNVVNPVPCCQRGRHRHRWPAVRIPGCHWSAGIQPWPVIGCHEGPESSRRLTLVPSVCRVSESWSPQSCYISVSFVIRKRERRDTERNENPVKWSEEYAFVKMLKQMLKVWDRSAFNRSETVPHPEYCHASSFFCRCELVLRMFTANYGHVDWGAQSEENV